MRVTPELKQVELTIGQRIKESRITIGWSREQLARKLGVTHQQLQKYENGTNRICVGRLLLACKALGRPLSYFVDEEAIYMPPVHQRMAIEVSRNFLKIPNPEHQTAVNMLIKSLTK